MTARDDYPTAAKFAAAPPADDDDPLDIRLAHQVTAALDEIDLLRAAVALIRSKPTS